MTKRDGKPPVAASVVVMPAPTPTLSVEPELQVKQGFVGNVESSAGRPQSTESKKTLALLPTGLSSLSQYLFDCGQGAFQFSWDPTKGSNCLTFVAGGVEALTGNNPYQMILSAYTGDKEYSSPVTARALLTAFGAGDLDTLLTRYFAERELVRIRMGDLILFPSDSDPFWNMGCAIAAPPYMYALAPEGGTTKALLSLGVKAFDPLTFRLGN